jgi:hypothetical protein
MEDLKLDVPLIQKLFLFAPTPCITPAVFRAGWAPVEAIIPTPAPLIHFGQRFPKEAKALILAIMNAEYVQTP